MRVKDLISKIILEEIEDEGNGLDSKHLIISGPNAKIAHPSFSLPAGWTCPGAKDCLSKADKETGKITDGPDTLFRCFSASSEATFPQARDVRHNNFDILKSLKTSEEMADVIIDAIKHYRHFSQIRVFRIHVSGDFYNDTYFKAWLLVARKLSKITFYAYTKALNFWVRHKSEIPNNFKLTASKGGVYDELIDKHHLKYCEVVFSEKEAQEKGLEIDHDDTHAYESDEPFALLLHGVQPKGSEAARALNVLKKQGKHGYGRKRNESVNEIIDGLLMEGFFDGKDDSINPEHPDKEKAVFWQGYLAGVENNNIDPEGSIYVLGLNPYMREEHFRPLWRKGYMEGLKSEKPKSLIDKIRNLFKI